MRDKVKVTITSEDGEVLDDFTVCHWRYDCGDDDQENIGSRASEALFLDRFRRVVKAH
jgi:hypothetical protein